jgi:hypothetical protein
MAGVAALLTLALAAAAAAPMQRASLTDLRERAGAYVLDYHHRLEAIVAEERYVQRSDTRSGGSQQHEERTLRSDFMLLPGTGREQAWFAFRDVFEVDGRSVSSERGRLEQWLAGSRASLMRNARALAIEQARYNIGPIMRTINVPTLALEVLLPDKQARFRFRLAGTATIDERPASVVTFEERRRPTMIRTPEGRDLPARGTLWIESATGRVLRTELRTGGRARDQVEAVLSVSYVFVPRLSLLLPASMEERYAGRGAAITCTAVYSNFRRFETGARIVR